MSSWDNVSPVSAVTTEAARAARSAATLGAVTLCVCFTRYIRRSASASRPSASTPCSGQNAAPTLILRRRSQQTANPASTATVSNAFVLSNTSAALSPGSTRTNSSPPIRAT